MCGTTNTSSRFFVDEHFQSVSFVYKSEMQSPSSNMKKNPRVRKVDPFKQFPVSWMQPQAARDSMEHQHRNVFVDRRLPTSFSKVNCCTSMRR